MIFNLIFLTFALHQISIINHMYSFILNQIIFKYIPRPRWQETMIEYFGRVLLVIPKIKKKYNKEIVKTHKSSIHATQVMYSQLPTPIITLPEQGYSDEMIKELLNRYNDNVLSKIQGKFISGSIYSANFIDEDKDNISDGNNNVNNMQLAQRLKYWFTKVFEISYLWNGLHMDEFNVCTFIEYQVIQMVASMFSSNSLKIKGIITSGGSQSLMTVIRCYRNYGMRELGHKPGDSVIIALDTVHPAVLKACDAYLVKIVLVKTDFQGVVNMKDVEASIRKNRYNVVALIASAPSYSFGKIDPINKFSKLAKKYNIGLHVDCCLGGFVVNFLQEYETNYLDLPGVTSLSCDTHKNGLAPKGSSVLVTKNLGTHNLTYYAIYNVPHSRCGVYATLNDSGSYSTVPSLTAMISMLLVGRKEYVNIAIDISTVTKILCGEISRIPEFNVLNVDYINVVAFEFKDKDQNYIYNLAHEAAKIGLILNMLRDNCVHFCITSRFIKQESCIEKFMNKLQTALDIVKEMISNNIAPNNSAVMYSTLTNVREPSTCKTKSKYLENILYGKNGVDECMRYHYLGQQDFDMVE